MNMNKIKKYIEDTYIDNGFVANAQRHTVQLRDWYHLSFIVNPSWKEGIDKS